MTIFFRKNNTKSQKLICEWQIPWAGVLICTWYEWWFWYDKKCHLKTSDTNDNF